ncbi:NAD(P)/FAD-dependent oxidoreductase [Leifsonia sp. H3M29-4]|uniref:phytoene desaturase family protein n=1 Tax=Salinibacterium metalliresistens TaxID=3031321 RepID=UPI0023DB49EA|nr:NAD(P)/FAD-dependent oxidoreductase [Salinibacterium metalliresistens]MDF1477833.1 NAD(P)/FAD-dependent oxidoreductase [Salinibacterium metalliresistens]
MPERRDVVIVGGGHNGLTAAAYLALAGQRVTVLERLHQVGGAAVSAPAFDGVDARLSRYSYLVSLLPKRIIRDLGLDITLARRRYSSYTPRPGGDDGLLIDNADATATATALGRDAAAWSDFTAGTARAARALFPTVTEPLLTRAEARAALGDDALWRDLIERPIGETIASAFDDDLVRGVVLTDALIGTFAPNIDESLAANRCFLYHVIGGETGDWDVPVGGMGAVTGELARAARIAGAEIITGAEVTAITPDGEVTFGDRTIAATWVLANVAPTELTRLLHEPAPQRPEGAQVKVNLLLSRLPRLRDASVDPVAAFGGTFHINETWSQLDSAYGAAEAGTVPQPLPCEIYCHSLTDPSILSPELQASGAQTLTVFGLHTPDRLIGDHDNDDRRQQLQAAVLASLDSVLAEPVEPLLLRDASGRPTIETKTTRDLEHALAMPGGNIFHGPLSWPFVDDDAELTTPAQRWGVATEHSRILLCGSGARRGGAVSGIGGHNAAMAVLESQ